MQRPGGDTLAGMAEQGGDASGGGCLTRRTLRRVFGHFKLDTNLNHFVAGQTAENGITDQRAFGQQHVTAGVGHRRGDPHAGSKLR